MPIVRKYDKKQQTYDTQDPRVETLQETISVSNTEFENKEKINYCQLLRTATGLLNLELSFTPLGEKKNHKINIDISFITNHAN